MTNFAFIFQTGGLGGLLGGIMPFLLIFAVFYFLIIVPQRRRQKALQDMIATLKPGDKIVTNGGIIATVKQVKEKSLLIMSADKSILEISRTAVSAMQAEEEKGS
ncbi:MAG: preprotein translocase subunit YajC [Acidobacteriota bacterium]|jgi:preprotein translocase subunit YajC|nr:preprotein translocase subunit YajC [Acidobacteriota bacterium]MDT5262037.1 preprotein translocase subunit YajC [Acidobacteriota bacterium]MDT7780521.1 preprotein translocase subunit YajC [Acidobacteriota bacterium]